MFGLFQPAFRYDANLRASSEPNGANWRRDGKTVVFGPEYAANVLDQEQGFFESGLTAEAAENAMWVMGVSAKELRKDFPTAISDAQKFRMSDEEKKFHLEQEPNRGNAKTGEITFERPPASFKRL